MQKQSLTEFHKDTLTIEGCRIGTIAGMTQNGALLVTFSGNQRGPLEAKTTASARERLGKENAVGKEVLLMFESNDPALPVVVDALYSAIDHVLETTEVNIKRPDHAVVDGKRIKFDAKEEIVLQCGEASITLTSAGKVLIKGEYLLSRSNGVNKIKGAKVAIN